MARKQYTEDEVLKSLSKKHDVKVIPPFMMGSKRTNGIVYVLNRYSSKLSNDLGNGSWGKIDYLVNHVGYYLAVVSQFN